MVVGTDDFRIFQAIVKETLDYKGEHYPINKTSFRKIMFKYDVCKSLVTSNNIFERLEGQEFIVKIPNHPMKLDSIDTDKVRKRFRDISGVS